MKGVKKILALVLVLALMFSLTGCTAFETKMAKAAAKMKKVDNLRADITFYLDADMLVLGQSLGDIELGVDGTLDIDKKHGTGSGRFNVESPDGEQDVLLYYEKSKDVLRTWTSKDDGKTWTLNEQALEQGTGSSLFEIDSITDLDREQLSQLRTVSETFAEDGTTEIRGSESTIYSGTVSVQTLMKDTDLQPVLEQMNGSTGIELTEEDLRGIGDMPVSIAIDNKSGLVSGFALDMTEMMQGIAMIGLKAYMGQGAGGEALGGIDPAVLESLGVTLSISHCEAESVLYDYDAVGDIVIPDSVRENAAAAGKAA